MVYIRIKQIGQGFAVLPFRGKIKLGITVHQCILYYAGSRVLISSPLVPTTLTIFKEKQRMVLIDPLSAQILWFSIVRIHLFRQPVIKQIDHGAVGGDAVDDVLGIRRSTGWQGQFSSIYLRSTQLQRHFQRLGISGEGVVFLSLRQRSGQEVCPAGRILLRNGRQVPYEIQHHIRTVVGGGHDLCG